MGRINPKRLFTPAQLTAAEATYYTPSLTLSVSCIVKKLTLTNTTAADVTVTIRVVPDLITGSDVNALWNAVTVSANTTKDCPDIVNQVLNPGDSLKMLASVAASVTAIGSGVEVFNR